MSPFKSAWTHLAGKTAPFKSAWTHLAGKTAPFKSEWTHLVSKMPPFKSELPDLVVKTAPFKSEWTHLVSKTAPFKSEWTHLVGKMSPFKNARTHLAGKTAPFKSELPDLVVKTAPFKSAWTHLVSKTAPCKSAREKMRIIFTHFIYLLNIIKNKNLMNDHLNFSGLKILLVEDNELNLEIASTILEGVGFEIETAENGKIAVEKVTQENCRYDLILMDIQMPVMDGYTATRKIRALNSAYCKTVPIIAMTANAFEEDKKNALAAGMNDHIAKPIDITAFGKILKRWLKTNKNV